MFPSAIEVPIHLEDEQIVYYEPTLASTSRVARQSCSSMLTAYYEANRSPDYEVAQLAKQVKYEDFPTHFVWQARQKCGPLGNKALL